VKKSVLLSLSAALLSGTTFSTPVKADPRLYGDPWTGWYFGAYFGAGAGHAGSSGTERFRQVFEQTVPGTTVTQVFTSDGIFGTGGDSTGSVADLFVGYNFRRGSFVWGGQVEGTIFSDVTLDTTGLTASNQAVTTTTVTGGGTTVTSASATGVGTFDIADELRSMVSGVARAGWLARPDTLLYVLGGGVLGHFVIPDSLDPQGGQRNKWALGWTVGAGGEYRINPKWSVRAEYRYVNFEYDRVDSSSNSSTQVTGTTTFSIDSTFARTTNIEVDLHLAKIGIVYTPWAALHAAGDAYAADFPLKAAPRLHSDPWTGWYFGAYFGAGAGHAQSGGTDHRRQVFEETAPGTTVTEVTIENRAFGGSGDATGSVADLFVGYNFRRGRFVWGGQVEGTKFSDVTLKTIGTRTAVENQTETTNAGGVITVTTETETEVDTFDNITDELRSMVSGVARAGWLARPDTLLYVLGGGVLGHFVIPDSLDPQGGQRNKWVLGWTVGAGGEYRINPNWSLRAEYRYVNFEYDRVDSSSNSSTQVTGTTTFSIDNTFARTTNVEVDLHLAKIGIVYTPWAAPMTGDAYAAAFGPKLHSDPWTGWYFGVYFGAGAGHAESSGTDHRRQTFEQTSPGTTVTQVFTDNGTFSGSGDATGSVANLFVGYNFRNGSFVWGGQVEGTIFSDVTSKTIGRRISVQSQTTTTIGGGGPIVTSSSTTGLDTFEINDELRSMVSGVARAGWLARPDALLYVLGGGVLGHFVVPDSDDGRGSQRNKWVLGWTLGAGGEYRINPKWSVRAEYRYVNFEYDRGESSFDLETEVTATTTFTNESVFARTTNVEVDLHLAKIGIVYTPWAAPDRAMDAYAADLPVKARPRPLDVWAGWHFGAYFGAGAGHADASGTDRQSQTFVQTVPGTTVTQVFTDNGSFGSSGDVTGSVADLFVGYNFRRGSFVWGGQVEGTIFSDVTLKTIGARASNQNQTTTTNVGGVITVNTASSTALDTFETDDELRSMFSGVARAGWLARPDTLLYALGGGVLGHFVIPDSEDPRGGQRNKWVLGWTVGAGGEYRINPNWSLRAEYRYVNFEYDRGESTFESSTQVTGTTTFTNETVFARTTNVEVDLHLAKIGIVFRP
jgi:opacity protein-like surface antigen